MKIVRIIAIVLLTSLFASLAFILYEKQSQRFTFRSFELPNQTSSLLITDLDRFLKRVDTPNQFHEIQINSSLSAGFESLWGRQSDSYNDLLGASCYLSFSPTDFSLVFRNQFLTLNEIVEELNTRFDVNAVLTGDRLSVAQSEYFMRQYGLFTHISSIDFQPRFVTYHEPQTNADYIVFNDSVNYTRTIIAYHQVYHIWNDTGAVVKGNTIEHAALLTKIPARFEQATFYGSSRFTADKFAFFEAPTEEAYSWIDGGIVVFKKGEFELMIAPQNDQRDLRLILEEQTINSKVDTLPIAYTTVKNFEIMPFKSSFNWSSEIPALSQKMTHYTEFENVNVMGNSLAAIQWYLTEIQTGNLLYQNEQMMSSYLRSTPLKAHIIQLDFDGDSLISENITWLEKDKRIHAKTGLSIHGTTQTTSGEGKAFEAPFEPLYILPLNTKGDGGILLSSNQKLALIGADGKLSWQVELSSPLLFAPELIDLENDGKLEFALFMQQGFVVYDLAGNKIPNLALTMYEPLKGGMCVNYDRGFDYRFFFVFDKRVVCYNEMGKVVTGWNFTTIQAPLTGAAYYTQINGIDFLTFKDVNSKVHLLNRKGENRFGPTTSTKLPNEADFVIGKNEELVHKLGYANQYIYTRFLKDGYTDSLKLDVGVNAVSARWVNGGTPVLVIEEPARILIFNTSGYLEQEILKPEDANRFIEVDFNVTFRYVFFNNSNNSLYLLNQEGRLLVIGQTTQPTVFGLNETYFYTFDGQKINEQKIK